MDRMIMVRKAIELACEQVDSCSALSEKRYKELAVGSHEKAIKILAMKFLEEAVNYNFGE